MPWKDIRPVDDRVRFIAAVKEDPRGNFAELCRRFGIHRSKGYKWLQRYREHGPAGLEDRKPIAQSCPHKTPDDVVDRVVAMRKEHPWDGPKKLRERLLELGGYERHVPAASTIGDILDRYGLIRPRRARLRMPPHPSPLEPCSEPNDLWCVDFKGHFACRDGRRCHPLTITDAASSPRAGSGASSHAASITQRASRGPGPRVRRRAAPHAEVRGPHFIPRTSYRRDEPSSSGEPTDGDRTVCAKTRR